MPNYTPMPPACQQAGPAFTALVDTDQRGRPRPWNQHKQEGQVLAFVYDLLENKKASRVRGCADTLTFARDEQGALSLKRAWFCRVRLCPMCQWRRSLKLYGQTMAILQHLDKERAHPYAYILLTLTQKNTTAAELPQSLSVIHAAWQRLMQRSRPRRAVKGWMRATEITYNAENDTYHHHIHAILVVNHSYFTSRDYMRQSEWQQLWQQAMRLSYTPEVNIKRIKSSEPDSTSVHGAVAEVSKYTAKPSEYLQPADLDASCKAVAALDQACARRRFVAWGGVMKQAHKQLGLDDAEDGDLLHTETESTPTAAGAALTWSFYSGPRLYLRPSIGGSEVDTP